jgi:tetratricopeptide (TPR) repeat protein
LSSTLPPGGIDPRYFKLYEEGLAYGHQRNGAIAALGAYLEAACIHPDIPNAHFGAWGDLEHLPGPKPLLRLAQLSSARGLYAASGEVLDALRLGTSLSDLRRHDQVVDLLEPLAGEAPGEVLLHGNLATSMRYIGRREEAVEVYRHAIALEPAATRRHHWLVNTLWELGWHAEAIAAFEAAPRKHAEPVPMMTRARAAWAYLELGNHERADELIRHLESDLYAAHDDHVGHTTEAGLVRTVRARIAATTGDSSALRSVQDEFANHTPWFRRWMESRGWLDDLGENVLPQPELDADQLFGWCTVEHQGTDATGPLRDALEATEAATTDEELILVRLATRELRALLHIQLGEVDLALGTIEDLEAYEVEDDEGRPRELATLRWMATFAAEDPAATTAAAEAARALANPWAPLMSAYAAAMSGATDRIRVELAELHRTVGLARPTRVTMRDPFVPRYEAGRNDPCPCGSGAKFKRCHGR